MLPIATSQLMGDSREFDVLDIFWGFLLIFGLGDFIIIKVPSVSVLSDQLLPLATSQLVGDNREFDVLRIFSPV